jgi:hypothetical protein
MRFFILAAFFSGWRVFFLEGGSFSWREEKGKEGLRDENRTCFADMSASGCTIHHPFGTWETHFLLPVSPQSFLYLTSEHLNSFCIGINKLMTYPRLAHTMENDIALSYLATNMPVTDNKTCFYTTLRVSRIR